MKKLKEERGSATVVLLVIILLIMLAGFGMIFYTNYPEILHHMTNSTHDSEPIKTTTDNSEKLSQTATMQFSEFSKLFENSQEQQQIWIDSEFSYINEVYLYQGKVYFLARNSALSGKDKENFAKLSKVKVEGIETLEGSVLELYQLPVDDIILISHKERYR